MRQILRHALLPRKGKACVCIVIHIFGYVQIVVVDPMLADSVLVLVMSRSLQPF